MSVTRRFVLHAAGALVGGAMALTSFAAQAADDTIKIGILHSLSGTMAISETTLKDVMLMLIEEQNKKGGLLGKKGEAVVVAPAANWPLFAEKARELIQKDKVDVVFGCWTSVSRKSVLPVFEELTGLLFYPLQYEGEERSINGDANVPFYKELANQGIKATDIPVVAFSVGEEELSGIDTKNLIGHLAAWNYFESIKTPENEAFIKDWHGFIKNDKRTTNDPMEATYIGFKMWTQAGMQAGTTDIDAVRQAMYGQKVKAPSGFTAVMNTNHHLSKPVMIGEIRADGQFDVVGQTKNGIQADAWSPFLAEDKGKIADWTFPGACGH